MEGWTKASLGWLSVGGPEFSMRIQRGIRQNLYYKEPNVSVSASQTSEPKYLQMTEQSLQSPKALGKPHKTYILLKINKDNI